MTPLQKAAQAVIDRWDSPLWKDQPHTGVYIAELRKALEAEQAQAVEPVGKVSAHRGSVAIEWTGKCPSVGTPLFTHPSPPPAGERAELMTEAQIFACDPVPHVMFDQQRIDFARAIEAFHGITGAKS